MDLNLFKKLVICDECQSYLDSPIVLPCNKIICESHVNQLKVNDMPNLLNCSSCNDRHQIPSDGFKGIDKIKEIINSEAHLSQEEKELHNEVNETIENIEKMVELFKKSRNESENLVFDDLNSIKSRIDLDIEIMKSKLDQTREKMFKVIDDSKKDFDDKFNEIKIDDHEKFVQDLKNQWSKEIRSPDINKNKELKLSIEVKLKEIQDELKNFEDLKFQNLYFNYLSNKQFIQKFDSTSFFGVLCNLSSTIEDFKDGKFKILYVSKLNSNKIIIKNEINSAKITFDKLKKILESNSSSIDTIFITFDLIRNLISNDIDGAIMNSIKNVSFYEALKKHLLSSSSEQIKLDILSILNKVMTHDPNQIKLLVELNLIKNLINFLSNESILICDKVSFLLKIILNFNNEFNEIAIRFNILNGLENLIKRDLFTICSQNVTSILASLKLNNTDYCNENMALVFLNYFLKLLNSFLNENVLKNVLDCLSKYPDYLRIYRNLVLESDKKPFLIQIFLSLIRKYMNINKENFKILQKILKCLGAVFKNLMFLDRVLVYSTDLNVFNELLLHEDNVIRNESILCLSRLCSVSEAQKTELINSKYFESLINLYKLDSVLNHSIHHMIDGFLKNANKEHYDYLMGLGIFELICGFYSSKSKRWEIDTALECLFGFLRLANKINELSNITKRLKDMNLLLRIKQESSQNERFLKYKNLLEFLD